MTLSRIVTGQENVSAPQIVVQEMGMFYPVERLCGAFERLPEAAVPVSWDKFRLAACLFPFVHLFADRFGPTCKSAPVKDIGDAAELFA